MSLDARYIFYYDNDYDQIEKTKDAQYLENEYGGEVIILDYHTVFYDMPKHTLCFRDFQTLKCDQILVQYDGREWIIQDRHEKLITKSDYYL